MAEERTPAFCDLVRVCAVAQIQEQAGTTVGLLSLELYDDGFMGVFRLLPKNGRVVPPVLSLEVRDDRGGHYFGHMGGGSGGPGEHHQWRLAYIFTPAVDPAARELRIEVSELRYQHYDKERGAMVEDEALRGPWVFTVPLVAEE
jgi:hypothetical protein